MKFRKTICLILVVLLFSLMALGSGDSSSSTNEQKPITSSSNSTTSEPTTTESAPATTTDSAPTTTTESAPAEPEIVVTTPTIEEQVVFDNEGVIVTAKEYVVDTIWGDGIKFLIENNSDKDVGVSVDDVIVNDFMVSSLFSETVAAGKKANETLTIFSTELKNAGIKNVGKIEVYFHTFDPNTYHTLYEADVAEIQTSKYDEMDSTPADIGETLFEEDGIKIVGRYVDESSIWGAGIVVYIENNSDKNINVRCEDMSINGFMVDPWFYSSVRSGKKAIDDITILSSDLEENDIDTIEDIELKFSIINADTYSTIKTTDAITFSTN